jgi:hypothetical protein
MRMRFTSLLESPDASEGTNAKSNYSMARSPKTALLFEASHTVVLPLVRFVEDMPSTDELLDAERKEGGSEQERH